jgi:hypothetical protein
MHIDSLVRANGEINPPDRAWKQRKNRVETAFKACFLQSQA